MSGIFMEGVRVVLAGEVRCPHNPRCPACQLQIPGLGHGACLAPRQVPCAPSTLDPCQPQTVLTFPSCAFAAATPLSGMPSSIMSLPGNPTGSGVK